MLQEIEAKRTQQILANGEKAKTSLSSHQRQKIKQVQAALSYLSNDDAFGYLNDNNWNVEAAINQVLDCESSYKHVLLSFHTFFLKSSFVSTQLEEPQNHGIKLETSQRRQTHKSPPSEDVAAAVEACPATDVSLRANLCFFGSPVGCVGYFQSQLAHHANWECGF